MEQTSQQDNRKDNILIVGGYGKVGRIISEQLALLFPYKVTVAGRDFNKATSLAKQLEDRVRPLYLDIQHTFDSDILSNTKLVIMCIDQKNTDFVELCIARGIHYIDITANQDTIAQIELLDEQATQNNVAIALSIGLAPGISNLLAQHSINTLREVDTLDLFILLGTGEKHGEAAFRWTFDNIHSSYVLATPTERKVIHSFTQPLKTALLGKRTFYTFNFSDQHTLLKTTVANQVITRMAFDSKLLTSFVALLKKIGLTKIFTSKKVQQGLLYLFERINIGTDIFAVKATVENKQKEKYTCCITGNGEGKVTAYVAVEIARYLLKTNATSGVRHIHQIVTDIPQFLERIKNYDTTIDIQYKQDL